MQKIRTSQKAVRPLHDFQVFKGHNEQTMKAFGGPVMVHHEARLIVRDDQASAIPGVPVLYAIYQRSENRILQILRAPDTACLKVAA